MAKCPACDVGNITESLEKQVFGYGTGDQMVELTVYNVPVQSCDWKDGCGLQTSDWRGEEIRDQAVARYKATGDTGSSSCS